MITAINCPRCNHPVNVNDWFNGFAKSGSGLYYFKCKACKIKIGSTLCPDGTLAIWSKEKEIK